MTEYIDAAAARAFVEDNYQGDPLLRHLYGTLLDKLPKVEGLNKTVDAVEVVRCGNCKHFYEPFCCRRDDEAHRERINMLTVDFCSYGERKDNG